MSWGRRLCVLLSALLVLTAVADAALQAWTRPQVMAALGRLAGTRVTAERLRIGPLGGVHVRGLAAGADLTVARLDLDLDLGAMLEGRVRPSRVSVAGVLVRLGGATTSPRLWRERAALNARADGLPERSAGAPPIAVIARDVTVQYHGRGRTAGLRIGRADGDIGAGAVGFTLHDVAARSGLAELRADEVEIQAPRALAPPVRVRVERGAIGVGGEALAEGLAGVLVLDAGGGELRLTGHAPGDGPTATRSTVALGARFGEDGGEGRLEARAFPLLALGALMRPSGVLPERARADAELAVRWRGPLSAARDVGASGRLGVTDLGLRLPRLAARDVAGISATLDGSARVMGGVLEVDRAVLRSGAVQSLVRLSLALAGKPRLTIDATLSETPCQDLVAALPEGLAPALRGLEMSGKLSARGHIAIDWARLADIEHSETVDASACRVVKDAPAGDVAALRGPIRHRVTDGAGAQRELVLGPGSPSFRPLARLSRHVPAAFLTAEDRHFWRHGGFDPAMLGRALGHDLAVGRIEKGASTITQQLAKNLFLTPDRTIGRKLEEAVLAWRLEQVLPKSRILELYLNVIELGPGVYGVAEAARHYFGKDPARLTPLEAAHLAAIAPNPRLFGRRPEAPATRERWHAHLVDLLGMMARANRLSPGEAEAARGQALVLRPPPAT